MKLLLDTHAALWWWDDSPKLGSAARSAIADPANEIHFSAASAYEIFQKVRLGRLTLPPALQDNLPSVVLAEGWKLLPLTLQEATAAASLDHAHRDAFDRMLAAQSKLGSFALATVDPFFNELEIQVIW